MKRWVAELLTLLEELEEEGVDFRAGADSRPVESERELSTTTKPGREKYELRRKAKRARRLLRRAEREGRDVATLLAAERGEAAKPRVTSRDRGDRWEVTVDEAGARVDVDGDTVVVSTDTYAETVKLPFLVGEFERTEKLDMTVFVLWPRAE